jgi:hypothetical protein
MSPSICLESLDFDVFQICFGVTILLITYAPVPPSLMNYPSVSICLSEVLLEFCMEYPCNDEWYIFFSF